MASGILATGAKGSRFVSTSFGLRLTLGLGMRASEIMIEEEEV